MRGTIPQAGRQRGRAGKAFLPACATNFARGRPALDGGRGVDGLGLLAITAKARTPAVQCFRTRTHAVEQASENIADSPHLAPPCRLSHVAELWNTLNPSAASS